MIRFICAMTCLGLAFLAGTYSFAQQAWPQRVVEVDVSTSISPATVDLLEDALDYAEAQQAHYLLVRLDTPGGLGTSMREMVQQILGSPIPVVVWVAPSGARAASAGVFLVAAAHVAVMAPQTTIGAASPVGAGGSELSDTMAAKVQNDILSLIRSVAKTRGRNVDWYMRAVTDAVSITAAEAAMNDVVDFLAVDREDLFIQLAAGNIEMRKAPVSERFLFIPYEPGLRHKMLAWLLDPQIAYLLLLAGMAGLFFEMTTPGAVFPGVFGGLCLLLGLYAMSILPTNAAGLLLILLGLVLFILEVKIVSYGLLGISATAAVFFGSVILFDFEYGFISLPLSTVGITVGGLALGLGAAVYLVGKAQRTPRKTGFEALVGMRAEVRSWDNATGQVFVHGELWKARGPRQVQFSPKDQVVVTGGRGLELYVTPAEHGTLPPETR